MMSYCPLCNIFTRLWMNLKLAVRGKWEKNVRSNIYIVIPKLRKHNELHINSSILHWKNKSILTVCHNFDPQSPINIFAKYKLYKSEWRKYFKLHYFSVTYQNLMAHVMGITILYIKCIYRHHSINSMEIKKNAISRTFVIFQFSWGCALSKKVWNYIYPQCIRNITL